MLLLSYQGPISTACSGRPLINQSSCQNWTSTAGFFIPPVSRLPIWRPRAMTKNNRFERQIRLFGKDGQDKLARLRACIVGVGGLGSHLVQQFALLGLGRITVIDPDIVEISNMNRLIGARFD